MIIIDLIRYIRYIFGEEKRVKFADSIELFKLLHIRIQTIQRHFVRLFGYLTKPRLKTYQFFSKIKKSHEY